MNLNEVFGEFVGKTISVVERNGELLVNDSDPVARAMYEAACKDGLSLRFLNAQADHVDDEVHNRANAYLEQAAPGIWCIADKFTHG